MSYLIGIGLLVLGGTASLSWADETPSVASLSLSCADAVERALAHNLSLKAKAQEVAIAKGDRLSSFQTVLPTADGTATYTRNLKKNVIFFPNTLTGDIDAIELGEDNSYDFRATVTQPLFDFGGMYYALKQSGLAQNASEAVYENAKNDIIYETTTVYYHLQYLDQRRQLAETALLRARKQLESMQARFKQGVVSRYESLTAEVEVKTREAGLLAAQNVYRQEERRFRSLLDLAATTRLFLTEHLALPEIPAEVEGVLQDATAHNPFLRGLHLSTESLKAAWKGSQRQWLPRLDGTFQYGVQGESDQAFPNDDDFAQSMNAGATLSVPFFDGLRREGTIAKTKAQYLKALYEMQAALRDFVDNVVNTHEALQSSLQDYHAQAATQALAQEAARQAQARYALHLMTSLERETAELKADDAATAALEAQWKAMSSKAALVRLIGQAPTKEGLNGK